MKILFAVSECAPFIKSGGLGDVAGALPKELKKMGSDVRVMMPKYSMIAEELRQKAKKITSISIPMAWRSQYCGIETLVHNDVTYYLIDNEYYFYRDSLYGHGDDGERFSFFCQAVLESLPVIPFKPDLIHCHDWHTGMVPFLLDRKYRNDPYYRDMRTVFTIHNLQFQGWFQPDILGDYLNLEDYHYHSGDLEYNGSVNFMKGAILSSNALTTVSPTYRDEIQTPFFGEQLDGILREQSFKLHGILNGIDTESYNPESDPLIETNYTLATIEKKDENKLALQRQFNLPEDKDIPVIAMVTRLTEQKGLSLVQRVMHELLEEEKLQLIVLGSGEYEYEDYFNYLAGTYPDQAGVYIGFSEEIAHKIYAGADYFLMPSLFEPCGLSQLISFQYGTVPIARETGGLNDTVQPLNETDLTGNGFTFTHYNAHDMKHTIQRALSFYQDEHAWPALRENAMTKDYSWAQSAAQYHELYSKLKRRH
ncbi:glycogen synthase GlgA [Jeotgalibacillus campisalis]|uniref:Glycogen synthase n=1 Tax=Jeotgalibacillus campisalis TaxID=220754 RepID=A0A0C2VDN1_9BACL|nr:glycogen synthase GlgA [Jeotgalibacillus campisalis]KIL47017.1 glycogen synthase [Jeotgalibacillus campisalis]